jgi:hypothetical protein
MDEVDDRLWKAIICKRHFEANLDILLEAFGDELAGRCAYREHRGLDAIYAYVAERYHWPPAQVRGMQLEDLRFLLAEEMKGWHAPPALVALLPDGPYDLHQDDLPRTMGPRPRKSSSSPRAK